MTTNAALRPGNASSWRRTGECGSDPGPTVEPELAVVIDPHSRLVHAARPVLDELAGALPAPERPRLLRSTSTSTAAPSSSALRDRTTTSSAPSPARSAPRW
jgi:hypothetical protein